MSSDDEQAPGKEDVEPLPSPIGRSPAFELFAAQQQTELDAKFAKLRAAASEAIGPQEAQRARMVKLLGGNSPHLDIGALVGVEAERVRPMIDIDSMPDMRAARAAERTSQHLEVLVDAALEAEKRSAKTDRREVVMLRWTIAGVVLAAIAAVASVIAIAFG